MGRHAHRPAHRSSGSSRRPSGRRALAAGSLIASGFALCLAGAQSAAADTAPSPVPDLGSVLATPSPDVTGTVSSVTTTLTDTVSSTSGGLPQPSATPTTLPTGTTSGTKHHNRTGSTTSNISPLLKPVASTLGHHRAARPARHQHRAAAPAAVAPAVPALGDLPAGHGWSPIGTAAGRTPLVAPTAPTPVAVAPLTPFAQAALHALDGSTSLYRRIATIVATMMLGLLSAGYIRSVRLPARA